MVPRGGLLSPVLSVVWVQLRIIWLQTINTRWVRVFSMVTVRTKTFVASRVTDTFCCLCLTLRFRLRKSFLPTSFQRVPDPWPFRPRSSQSPRTPHQARLAKRRADTSRRVSPQQHCLKSTRWAGTCLHHLAAKLTTLRWCRMKRTLKSHSLTRILSSWTDRRLGSHCWLWTVQ